MAARRKSSKHKKTQKWGFLVGIETLTWSECSKAKVKKLPWEFLIDWASKRPKSCTTTCIVGFTSKKKKVHSTLGCVKFHLLNLTLQIREQFVKCVLIFIYIFSYSLCLIIKRLFHDFSFVVWSDRYHFEMSICLWHVMSISAALQFRLSYVSKYHLSIRLLSLMLGQA